MGEDLGDASSARQTGPSLGLAFAAGSTMAAMIFKGPQRGQCSRSISNTRLSNRAQLRRAGAAAGGASEWSAEGVWALTGTVGMNSGRSLALGANTPWNGMDAFHL